MALSFKTIFIPAMLAISMASLVASPSAHAENGRKRSLLEGAALGVVGGVVLDRVLQGNGIAVQQPAQAAAPVYVDQQPTYAVPQREYEPQRPAYVPVRARPDPYFNSMSRLKAACDDGDTGSCIKFGIIIGEHKERKAEWRRNHPDMFEWDHG